MVNATLEDIRPRFAPQHDIDPRKVAAIKAAVTVDAEAYEYNWTMPPVVVIEDEGNGYTVLDGHHRGTAARDLHLETIPAWVISVADYARIVEEHFDGSMPHRIADLREHIMCGDVDANYVAPDDGHA